MRQTILRLHRELGLTILLSSHLLNEVEHLCTRIAVLNQGRMVFEGTLDETRRGETWVRLKVGDFKTAARDLRAAELICDHRGDAFILPCQGVGTDRIVSFLVTQGMPVYEIAPEQVTLEDFYLKLMNAQAKGNVNTGDQGPSADNPAT